MLRTLLGLLGFAWVLATSTARATPMFMGLGQMPGGGLASAFDVSADGAVVVGIGSVFESRAFRWTPGTGAVGLGDPPESISSEGHAASADGSVIVGHVQSLSCSPGCSSFQEPFRWTASGGMVGLGFAGLGFDVSADGSVIVGRASDSEAFRWSEDAGMQSLGFLPGATESWALGVSGDGSVVVGYSTSASAIEAFVWTPDAGMVGLGDLPGGHAGSEARDVSADGSVVVGLSAGQSFRWTPTGGMASLGALPNASYSEAFAVSADGSVIVGTALDANNENQAYIWTANSGMQSLRDVLVSDYGFDLTGWSLNDALGVSADGRTIVGQGLNPDEQPESWIAVLPEPSLMLVLALGFAGLVIWSAKSTPR